VATLVSEDFRWRRPDRHRELCRHAAGLLRERIEACTPTDRERLTRERLRLLRCLENGPATADGAELSVEPGSWADHGAFRSLPRGWRTPGVGRDWLAIDGSRLRVIRDETGKIIAGSLVVPLCDRTLPEVMADPELAPALRRYWSSRQPPTLPTEPEEATGFCLVDLRCETVASEAAARELWRDLVALLARGGVHFAVLPRRDPSMADRLPELGFRPVHAQDRTTTTTSTGAEARVLALDVAQIGTTAWQDLVLSAKRPRVPVTSEELVAELRTLLPRWHDDTALAESSLAALAAVPSDASDVIAAGAARRLTETALTRTRDASPATALAYRALDLAFLTRIGSHERVAERLAVSRSTLYRLLRRAEEGLSMAILSAPSSSPDQP
jgi:hypothetical protein